MSRVNQNRLDPKARRALVGELIRAIESLRQKDVWPFLSELLTPGEVLMLGRRIRIARALLAGQSFEEIAQGQRVSFSTIQAVHGALERGLRGYRRVLPRADAVARRRTKRRHMSEEAATLLHLPGSSVFRLWLPLLDAGEPDDK